MNTEQTLNLGFSSKRGVGLSVALWTAQVLLAAGFIMSGGMKLLSPEQVAHMLSIPQPLVLFIGTSELLGAIGLILPSLLRIQPRLTVYAAWGLVLVMLLATIFHLSRGEFDRAPMTGILGLLAAFVSVGRSKWRPIMSRKG